MFVFFFTDIEGSTRLWELHTGAMTAVIARHDEILREVVTDHGGRITKHTGDGITAAFDGGFPLACALQAQLRFAAEPWVQIGALPIRIGLHAGEAEFHPSAGTPEGDFFGPPVNATARVMSAAWGGQILLTPEVTRAAPLPDGATLLDLGQHLLKNVSAPQQLYQLLHPQLPRHEFPPPRTLSGHSIRQAVGQQGGELATLEPQALGLTLVAATLEPTLQGELDPESGALEGNLGILEDLGALSLRRFLAGFAQRLQRGDALSQRGDALSPREIQILLRDELEAQWQAGGETALALRADTSRLLQAVHGVDAVMAAATDEVKEALARGLAGLGGRFTEFRWMLAGVQDTLAEVRARQALQLALQREQLDLQRQQLVKTNLLLHHQRGPPSPAEAPPAVELLEGDVEEVPPAQVACPYMGLAAFEADDAEYFFGREELVAELTARLAGTRFLAVVGPSGSGKSSLVRAGLLPAIWAGALPGSQDWQTLVLTPGAHPLEELATRVSLLQGISPGFLLEDLKAHSEALHLAVKQALAEEPPSVKLLLVVDQFEEVFALCRDQAERQRFIDALLYAVEAAVGSTIVLPTIRADFYGRCADYADLAGRLADGLLVGPMSQEELCSAIERPAAVVGLRLEPGLVELILDDVAGEPGALPLLSHALLETWHRRRGRTLTLSGYTAAGGVAGAIAQTADTVYGQFSPEEQAIARNIFLRLTELGEEGTQDTRRRVAPSELVRTPEEAPAVESVTKTLADARLITTGAGPVPPVLSSSASLTVDSGEGSGNEGPVPSAYEGTIEVAHEALIREWPLLRSWLDEDREGLRVHRHLTEAAHEWAQLDRDPGELYRGARLAAAGEWAEAHGAALNPLEREFLEASKELAWRREAEREAQRQRELEAARALAAEQEKRAETEERRAEEQARAAGRLRRRALLLAGAMVVAALLAVVALLAFRQATQSANTAQVASTQAVSERYAAETAQALEADQRAAAQAEADARATQQVIAENETQARATQQAIAEAEAQARATQQAVAEQKAREALEAYSLSLAAHARQALAALDPVTALALAATAAELEQPPALVRQTLMEAAYARGPRHRFDIQDLFGAGTGDALSVALSPDGRSALVGLDTGTVILLNPQTGAVIRRLEGHIGSVNDVAFSPDGRTALSVASIPTVILWDLASGQEIRRFRGHSGDIMAVDFSPDGRIAVSGGFVRSNRSEPGELILWDVETGQELRRCSGGHRDAVIDVAFSPDGDTVLASSGASTDSFTLQFWSADQGGLWSDYGENETDLILWDVATCEIVRRFATDDHDNFSLAISPDGDWALAGSTDQHIYRWDLRSGMELSRLEGHRNPVTTIALSEDGRRALSGEAYGHGLILWDLDRGEPLAFLNAHDYEMWTLRDIDLDLSPDGRWALSSSTDGALVLWDLVDWRESRRLEGHVDPVTDLAFTPDGLQLVSSSGRFDPGMSVSRENSIHLWALDSGELVNSLRGHTDGVTSIAVSPDGQHLLSASIDESVRLWDLEAGDEVRRLSGHGSWVTDVAFSPDGRTALSGSVLGTLLLWDLEGGVFTHSFPSAGGVFALAMSPDGRMALSAGSGESPVYVWDLDEGYDVGRFWEHAGPNLRVGALAVTPDGRRALSGDSTGTLILWEIASAEEVRRLSGHTDAIAAISIGADGRQAFTCDEGGTSILWALASGSSLGRFSAPGTGRTGGCALSPNGHLGATGLGNDIVLWQLGVPSLDELRAWIQANRYVRELTPEERELYQIETEP